MTVTRVVYLLDGQRLRLECEPDEVSGAVADLARQGLTITYAGRAGAFPGFGRIAAQALEQFRGKEGGR